MAKLKRNDVQEYLNWRDAFLKKEQEKNNDNLQCVYCGKENLDIGFIEMYKSKQNLKNPNLATVDHIVPTPPNHKERMNPDICVVSCVKCNSDKKDTDPKFLPPPQFGNCSHIDKWKCQYFKDMTPCIDLCEFMLPTGDVKSNIRYCKKYKKRLEQYNDHTNIIIKYKGCDVSEN